ncbi:MAG: hypothetical protein Q4C40_07365 [Eubacteriales bacterium]|nr:hypothetical protein [Eubacteriales bacterium]
MYNRIADGSYADGEPLSEKEKRKRFPYAKGVSRPAGALSRGLWQQR